MKTVINNNIKSEINTIQTPNLPKRNNKEIATINKEQTIIINNLEKKLSNLTSLYEKEAKLRRTYENKSTKVNSDTNNTELIKVEIVKLKERCTEVEEQYEGKVSENQELVI